MKKAEVEEVESLLDDAESALTDALDVFEAIEVDGLKGDETWRDLVFSAFSAVHEAQAHEHGAKKKRGAKA